MSSTWETLSKIDVSEHTEEKNGLTYLSWAWAWGKVKDNYPKARYVKRIWDTELPYTKDDQGYAYVEVTVIIGDEEQSELMPVLDYKNQSVKNPNSFQVNTALQRCLAKCCAMHGLGHYIYAGEDLPMDLDEQDSAFIIEDFSKAKDIDQIDATWRKHSAAISTLGKVQKNKVTDEFKKAKNKLKAA